MVSICPHCKRITSGERICPKCGADTTNPPKQIEKANKEEIISAINQSLENNHSADMIVYSTQKSSKSECKSHKTPHRKSATPWIITVSSLLALFAALLLTLNGCVSKEDKALAQVVVAQIDSIDSVTLENADELYNIYKAYTELTVKQQRLVKNSGSLLDMMSRLEQLIEIANDPTNSITKSELTGIWKEESTELHIGYFYFTSEGRVYYLAARVPINESDFTPEYRLSESYSLNDYNEVTRAKDGEFFNTATISNGTFSVTKDSFGVLTMEVKCGAASGTYKKTAVKVDTVPLQCEHPGCTNQAAETGDSHYCEEHSNKCLECNKFIDEDALYCINCIFKALNGD